MVHGKKAPCAFRAVLEVRPYRGLVLFLALISAPTFGQVLNP